MPISTFIAGCAQHSLRNARADHPAALMAETARMALADAGVEPASVDTSFKEAFFYLTEIGPVMYWHATDAIATPAEGG
jgi:hypothetical protein